MTCAQRSHNRPLVPPRLHRVADFPPSAVRNGSVQGLGQDRQITERLKKCVSRFGCQSLRYALGRRPECLDSKPFGAVRYRPVRKPALGKDVLYAQRTLNCYRFGLASRIGIVKPAQNVEQFGILKRLILKTAVGCNRAIR